MKFKIEDFFDRFIPACSICFGVILLFEYKNIVDIILGIVYISMGILIFIMDSSDFNITYKSKVEKAEEKAIKYKEKLEKKHSNQRKKEYKLLKNEIFKCIIKGVSAIPIPVSIEPIFTIRDRLNCDRDFRGLCFSVYDNKIYWERKVNNNG